ncbi:MAG: hypothetical protein NC218_09380 [Acetobacter sp.]|nr:hypothetical protein [Acetobacter sp.]
MAEFTANTIQTVAVGQNILFTETPVEGCRSIIHRAGSGLVTLRGNTEQCRARFKAFFSGNIAVPTGSDGPISLAIAIDGEPIATSSVISSPFAVEQYNNVSTAVFIDVPKGCCFSIAVENSGTVPVNVQNANLIVERVA